MTRASIIAVGMAVLAGACGSITSIQDGGSTGGGEGGAMGTGGRGGAGGAVATGGAPGTGGRGGVGGAVATGGAPGTGGRGGAGGVMGTGGRGGSGGTSGAGGAMGTGGRGGAPGAGGMTGAGGAVDAGAADRPCLCSRIYAPVCGTNNTTYGNQCEADCAGVPVAHTGECATPNCSVDADCARYGLYIGGCCGACQPVTDPRPPQVQCTLMCTTPITACTCVNRRCTPMFGTTGPQR